MFKKLMLGLLASIALFTQAQAEVTIKSTKPYENKKQSYDSAPVLSEEHREQVSRITLEYNEKLKAYKPQIKKLNKELKTELAKDNPDATSLEALNSQLYDLKKQEQLVKIQYQLALSKVLTAQQRKALATKAAIKKAKNSTQQKQQEVNVNQSPYRNNL